MYADLTVAYGAKLPTGALEAPGPSDPGAVVRQVLEEREGDR